jgi:hypothetical protein
MDNQDEQLEGPHLEACEGEPCTCEELTEPRRREWRRLLGAEPGLAFALGIGPKPRGVPET